MYLEHFRVPKTMVASVSAQTLVLSEFLQVTRIALACLAHPSSA